MSSKQSGAEAVLQKLATLGHSISHTERRVNDMAAMMTVRNRALGDVRSEIREIRRELEAWHRATDANTKSHDRHHQRVKYLRNKCSKHSHEKRLATRVRKPVSNTDRPGESTLTKQKRASWLAKEKKEREKAEKAAAEAREKEELEVLELRRQLEARELKLARRGAPQKLVDMSEDGALQITVPADADMNF